MMSQDYVRSLIKSFNQEGPQMLKPHWKPGGNKKFTPEQKAKLF
jgi:hypothetical protein